jgi:DNA-binding MarR family transcriptional regulator
MHAAWIYEGALDRVAARHGISRLDVYLLMAMRRAGRALTPTELLGEVSVTMGAITKRIDQLVEAGLVQRRPDRLDGRSVRIALSASGRRIVDRDLLGARPAEFLAARDEFTDQEFATLTTLLRRLLVRLEHVSAEPVSAPTAVDRGRTLSSRFRSGRG